MSWIRCLIRGSRQESASGLGNTVEGFDHILLRILANSSNQSNIWFPGWFSTFLPVTAWSYCIVGFVFNRAGTTLSTSFNQRQAGAADQMMSYATVCSTKSKQSWTNAAVAAFENALKESINKPPHHQGTIASDLPAWRTPSITSQHLRSGSYLDPRAPPAYAHLKRRTLKRKTRTRGLISVLF